MQHFGYLPGNIFFIPLFLGSGVKENLKDYSKFKFSTEERYAFGRLIKIDKSGGDLVEIFNYMGSIPQSPEPIIQSGLMLNPLHVSMGFDKKRWKFIFESNDYDPVKDSDYNNISFLLGDRDNYILWKGGQQIKITNEESARYDPWIVYSATKVENIIKGKYKI